MSLIGSTSFGFEQITITRFLKYRIELIVALSSTNATKIITGKKKKNSTHVRWHRLSMMACVGTFYARTNPPFV